MISRHDDEIVFGEYIEEESFGKLRMKHNEEISHFLTFPRGRANLINIQRCLSELCSPSTNLLPCLRRQVAP
ncbi:MAG: hypothetical protein HYT12_03375 [Candidatus Liptonbacteria bacterium]|nr:hypothetical protein [Candidatus Liptonbacteria bacterium]